MSATKKLTKRKALSLLKHYFKQSERSRKIGAMEIETELSYQDKVVEQNMCYQSTMAISKMMEGFDLDSLLFR